MGASTALNHIDGMMTGRPEIAEDQQPQSDDDRNESICSVFNNSFRTMDPARVLGRVKELEGD